MRIVQQGVRRLGYAVRSLAPEREVRRQVQGTELRLPWSHRLPDYVAVHATYGRNIVELAAALAARSQTPLQILDIGANVGDTALQILREVEARVLCVEGDPHWLTWLERNVGDDPRVVIEPSLVSVDGDAGLSPVRHGGTTRFEASATGGSARLLTPRQLHDAHPDFAGVWLVKCDTDGFDVPLVPALATAWGTSPVLFFEYDHRLARLAGNDPLAVWPRLAALGYDEVGAWDNHGRPLGRLPLAAMAERSGLQDRPRRGWDYWDVAVVHRTDKAGASALSTVLPDVWTSQGS